MKEEEGTLKKSTILFARWNGSRRIARIFSFVRSVVHLLRNYATREDNLFAINLIKRNKRRRGGPLLLINLKTATRFNYQRNDVAFGGSESCQILTENTTDR